VPLVIIFFYFRACFSHYIFPLSKFPQNSLVEILRVIVVNRQEKSGKSLTLTKL